jgi:hypothetical protein
VHIDDLAINLLVAYRPADAFKNLVDGILYGRIPILWRFGRKLDRVVD